MQQIISTIRMRRAPTRHDTIDFQPLITKTSKLFPLSVVIGDKGYDSEEDNHVLSEHTRWVLMLYHQDMNGSQYEGHMGDTQNK